MATKTVRALSSAHAICSPMTSLMGLCTLHIYNDNKRPRDFSEALSGEVMWGIGSNRTGTCI